jgi:hypothetical protein
VHSELRANAHWLHLLHRAPRSLHPIEKVGCEGGHSVEETPSDGSQIDLSHSSNSLPTSTAFDIEGAVRRGNPGFEDLIRNLAVVGSFPSTSIAALSR